ncbi:amino acid permease [Corynebacterium pyruviciproducens]|uniref:amino acid permease n=1 Tax=Corynebacterium pyruviciproducens TaxID=598660 RepID=UPI0023F401D4|nr:amino acid permease [Corynebacterium pyruviciproducens]
MDEISTKETEGYKKDLKPRHIQMIALGGALGTGLFLGAGGRLAVGGPGLALVYVVCGLIGYLMLRSLGEMVVHRPTSGSFASYSREFLGERAAFVAGWIYFLAWVTVGTTDLTAVAIYLKFWPLFHDVPQWVLVACALVVVLSVNLLGVKVFGEAEYWFAAVKVSALVIFLVVGVVLLVTGHAPGGTVSATSVADWFPHGVMPLVILTQGVVFAYAGIDMIGVTAGETADPEHQIPKAINTTVFRIVFFYVGSILLLGFLLPYTAYSAGESPFVTFMNSIGVPYAGDIMNLVVLTAALSSVNAGLYATSRILRPLALSGSAPGYLGKLSEHGVPKNGILTTATLMVVGIVANYFVPELAFEVFLNLGAIGILGMWAMICLSHLGFVRSGAPRPAYRSSPLFDVLVLAFLFGVFILMAFDKPVGTATVVVTLVGLIPAFAIGWYFVSKHQREKTVAVPDVEKVPAS